MEKLYRTTDFDFSTLLYYEKKKLKNLEGPPNRRVFVFVDDGTIDELRLKYINRELLVDPQGLWNATKAIKTLIHGNL